MVTSSETEESAKRRAAMANNVAASTALRRRTAQAAASMVRGGRGDTMRRGRDAMNRLIVVAARETRRASIDDLLDEFQATLDEFHALSQPLRSANAAYDRMYQRMVGKFLESYPTLRLNVVYLNLGKYSVDRWGPVYWRFFHLSAILLLELFANHRVDDVLDYPSLLFNIDTILPCPTCAWHYQQIKRSESVLSAVKEMSFARLMNGARYFHNLVTMHQNELPEFQTRPPRPPFTVLDYAERYGCLEDVPEDLVKTATYVRGWVDWQPTLHRRLTLFHAMRSSIPYAVASRQLKRTLYNRADDTTGNRDNDDRYYYNDDDDDDDADADGNNRSYARRQQLSRDAILRSIAYGMVGAVKNEYRETLLPYATRFYETYPAEAAAVAESLLELEPGGGDEQDNDHATMTTSTVDDVEEIRRCARSTLASIHRATNGEYGRADLDARRSSSTADHRNNVATTVERNGRDLAAATTTTTNGAASNNDNGNEDDDDHQDVHGDVEMLDDSAATSAAVDSSVPLLPSSLSSSSRGNVEPLSSTLRQRRRSRRPPV